MATSAFAQETSTGWEKYAQNPILGGKHLGTCFDLSLIREDGVFKMWFSWRPKKSLAYTESRDGIHWAEPKIVLGPNPETEWETDINRPGILKRDGVYHLWYTGQTKDKSWIGYATSRDGISWKRISSKPVLSAEAPWEKVAVMCPHVEWDDSAKLYKMWYSGGRQIEPDAIGYATSPDGVNWTKHAKNPIFSANKKNKWEQDRVTGCQVIKHDDWYVMFYIGFENEYLASIGIARSKDGVTNWERLPTNPIIRPREKKWDGHACYKPFALYDATEKKWRLWYNGRIMNLERIGLATHAGEDLGFPKPVAAVKTTQSVLSEIEKRAKEIEPFLSDTPQSIGRPITDRVAWEKIATYGNAEEVIKKAESRINEKFPRAPEELYKEYHRNGNRTNFQKWRSQKYSLLGMFALAECLENKGRFLAPLEESIKSACDDPSWLYPAHDGGHRVYDGKSNHIDLASSDMSANLALIYLWFGDKLSPETRKLIRDNLERRTFSSYEQSITKWGSNWWLGTTNNWNAVCHANVLLAALSTIESKERRAFYIASTEYHTKRYFFAGFTPDGYCSEGVGYWNYGFGHFIYLAETIWQATGGKVDLFQIPKVKNCALFAINMEVAPNQFAAFADCSSFASADSRHVDFLNRRLQLGYKIDKAEDAAGMGIYSFPNSASALPAPKDGIPPLDAPRTVFPDAGVVIGRNKDGLSFVCKAGHNGEHHNHNDVGSFTVMYKGGFPVLDPGAEVYTARTFSSKRYDSKLLNSWGHPVPVVNGQLQKAGGQYRGKILSSQFTEERDVVLMDIAPAYALKEVKKMTRKFDFNRKKNTLVVTDEIELNEAGTLETALITYSPFRRGVKAQRRNATDTIRLIVGEPKGEIGVLLYAEADGKRLPLEFVPEEIKEDSGARKKATRLGYRVKGEVKRVRFVTEIRGR